MKKFNKPTKSRKFSRKQLVSIIASLRGELTSLINGVSVVLAKEEVKTAVGPEDLGFILDEIANSRQLLTNSEMRISQKDGEVDKDGQAWFADWHKTACGD